MWNPCIGMDDMRKTEMIDQIRRLNPSAQTEFLASFSEDDLLAYLHQLKEVERARRRNETAEFALVE